MQVTPVQRPEGGEEGEPDSRHKVACLLSVIFCPR